MRTLSSRMLYDVLTKPLATPIFRRLRASLIRTLCYAPLRLKQLSLVFSTVYAVYSCTFVYTRQYQCPPHISYGTCVFGLKLEL